MINAKNAKKGRSVVLSNEEYNGINMEFLKRKKEGQSKTNVEEAKIKK